MLPNTSLHFSRTTRRRLELACLAALSLSLGKDALRAAAPEPKVFWIGTAGDGVWTSGNWALDSAGTQPASQPPDPSTDVTFSATAAPNAAKTTTLGQNFTIHSLTIRDTSAVTINSGAGGPFQLTIAGDAGTGIDVQSGAGSVTVGANVTLAGASNTVTVNNAAGAVLNGILSGANGLTKAGAGMLTLSGANNYSGSTAVSHGTLVLNNNRAAGGFGAGTILLGDAMTGRDNVELQFGPGVNGTDLTVRQGVTVRRMNPVTVTNTGSAGTVTIGFQGTPVFVYSDLTLNRAAVIAASSGFYMGQITGPGAGAGNDTIIFDSSAAGFTLSMVPKDTGSASLVNTYAGNLRVRGGTLEIQQHSYISDVPANNNLNIPDTASVTVDAGARLIFVWGDETFDALNGSGIISRNTGDNQGIRTLTIGASGGSGNFSGSFSATTVYQPDFNINKTGSGTQVFGGTNTYAGTTTVTAGVLQFAKTTALYNGSTASWTPSKITVHGGGTLAFSVGGSGEFTAGDVTTLLGNLTTNLNNNGLTGGSAIGFDTTNAAGGRFTVADNIANSTGTGAGSLGLTKLGTNTLVLSGTNTYTGTTVIDGGSLIVNGAIASASTLVNRLGVLGGGGIIGGNVLNQGAVNPGNSPGTLTVKGNYTQASSGTLVIEVAGLSAGQHDVLAVGGQATLDGGLRITKVGGATLKRGDKLTFLTAGGGVNGQFATVSNAFETGNPLLDARVVYQSNSVSLEMLQGSFAALDGLLGLTQNQLSTARALDRSASNPKFGPVLDYLDYRPLSEIPGDLDLIAPEEYAAFSSLAVSLANVQTANLLRRMDDLRAGVRGFSNSGYAVSGRSQDGTVYGDRGPAGKGGKELVAPAENRLGVFINGSGEFTNIGGTANAQGYDLTTGGISLGLDYRLTDHLAIGLTAGYAHTGVDLFRGGSISVDGGSLGLYGTYFDGGFHVDAAVTGSYSSYDVRRTSLQGTAHGTTDGSALNALIAAGYDVRTGGWLFGPTASFQYTHVSIDGFGERGSLTPLRVANQDSDSLRTAFGFKASYDWRVGGVVIKPEVRAAWQHEYGDTGYQVDSRFVTGGGNFAVSGPEVGRDSMLVGAGFAVLWNERTATYVYYDGELFRTNYNSQNVSGGVRVAF
ncbi:MAG: autotransporter domain-containing protein [Chthoniobacter sp.]|nr:autotransporter domain-containing protein [Chthoniobacter sp.]